MVFARGIWLPANACRDGSEKAAQGGEVYTNHIAQWGSWNAVIVKECERFVSEIGLQGLRNDATFANYEKLAEGPDGLSASVPPAGHRRRRGPSVGTNRTG